MRLPPILSKVSSLATSVDADASVDRLGNMLGLDEIGHDHVRFVVGCTDKGDPKPITGRVATLRDPLIYYFDMPGERFTMRQARA
jgi:hypothetical protein